jgi:hypothetical protein
MKSFLSDYTKFALFSTLLLSGQLSYSQDLAQLGVDKGVKLNGSINFSAIGYKAFDIPQRRDPFNWFVTGNLNVNLFGYSAPFSFSYSNANSNFSQPFNQFSFAPQYKWVKTYIGYNAMTFSRYTLAGHVFFGGGVELTPGKWRVAAMYGRLRQAVPFNLNDSLQNDRASFRRMGYGVKVGYEDSGNAVYASIFAAEDDVTSIPFVLPNTQLTPMQNVAVSLAGRKRFLKHFFVDAEYAVSALNKDTKANSEQGSTALRQSSNFIQGLLPQNATSRYYDAVNASIGYQAKWYTIQLKYERVAPEYQTLGAYFFNNDMQNITIAPTVRLLKAKLTLAANVGLQNNNLDNARASTTSRNVGALNANYTPNEKWNFASSYSNFSSFTNVRKYSDPFFQNKLDTLNFYQVSQTLNANVIRNLGGKENPQSIMLNTSFQNSSDQASYKGGGQKSDFLSANLSYSYAIAPSNFTMALSANMYRTQSPGLQTTFWGPTVSLTKAFLEKTLRLSMATTYNQTATNGAAQTSPIINNRLSLNYAPKPKDGNGGRQTFSFGLNTLKKLEEIANQPAFTEMTGTINYTHTFGGSSSEKSPRSSKVTTSPPKVNKQEKAKVNTSNSVTEKIDELAALRAIQKERIERLKNTYDEHIPPLAIGGKAVDDIDQSVFSSMLEDLRKIGVVQPSESFPKINGAIKDSKTVPVLVRVDAKTKLYKIVPRGHRPPTAATAHSWFTKEQVDELTAKGSNFESMTSQPLKEIAEEYDIYQIEARSATNVYTSEITPMRQQAYSTKGGSQQVLILDHRSWSKPIKFGTYIPDSPTPDGE